MELLNLLNGPKIEADKGTGILNNYSTKTSFNLFDEKKNYILLFILIAALTLRIWGIWFGLPHLYGVDEGHEVLRAMRLGTGSFDFNRIGKGGYFYLLFFEYGIYFLILKLIGTVHSATEFAQMFIREPWSFYLIGRITTALIGTLNVFFVYLIGKEIYSRKAGILAALFFAFNFLHALKSHLIQVDTPMTCLVTIAFYFYIRIVRTGNNSSYIKAGVFTGLAVITKFPAIILLAPLSLAHYFNISKKKYQLKELIFRKEIVTVFSVFLVVMFLGNPGLFLKLHKILYGLLQNFVPASASSTQGAQYLIDTPNLFLYYFHAIGAAMGLPLLLVSIAGVLYGVYNRKKEDVLLIAFVLIYYVMFSFSKNQQLYYPRYMMPILPVLSLLGSSLLCKINSKIPVNIQTATLLIFSCILIVEPGYRIVLKDYQYSHKDTRTFAKEWIEKNITAGSKILIEGSRTNVVQGTVPLKNNRENILKSIENYKDKELGKAKYLKLGLSVLSGVTYDLTMVGPPIDDLDFRLKPISYYKRIGVEYMVLRPDVYLHHRKLKKEFEYFVQSLKSDPEVKLIKRFEPDRLTRPGPAIEIYQIISSKTNKINGAY